MLVFFATAASFAAVVKSNEISVDNPGAGVTVLAMEAAPDILGFPWDEDPPIVVTSPVPVQVLRYSDHPQFFLEGEQPLSSSQVYVVVKSDCGDDTTLIPQIDYSTENRTIDWDTSEYTTSIDISFPSAEDDAIDTETFLDASVFHASWGYTSFWCEAQKNTDAPSVVPQRTRPPSTSEEGGAQQKDPDAPDGDGLQLTNPAQQDNGIPVSATAPVGSAGTSTKTLVSLMVALLLSVCLTASLGSDRSGKSNLLITMVVVMLAMLMATSTLTNAEPPITNSKTTTSTTVVNKSPRKLQQCAVTVEILIDGCRRAQTGTNLPDLEIIAPAVRVMDGEIQEMASSQNSDDPCFTALSATFAFNESLASGVTSVGRQIPSPVVSVGSFSPELVQYGACFRAVEGRPFIDSDGRHVHAKAGQEVNAAWSAPSKDSTAITDKDETLGKQWLDRAVGEHASVPAFAAYTIALMSNNAPPELVQDALSAAQDEVRHAKTSFEVASLLLGKTMEPGPLPSTSLAFSQDMKTLALGAAKEGCVDETLSALVAGLEVDFEIDQNQNLSEETKKTLKEKMRTIAFEETSHSGLAWRTVRWACSVDVDACKAVQKEVFHDDYFEMAFAKRFAHLDESIASVAKQVWVDIYTKLIPIVVGRSATIPEIRVAGTAVDIPALLCLEENLSHQFDSVLEEMGQRIISHLTCSL
ncbi:hypothetical protein IV203_038783 [Nitzschia inconspicua]|uniref:Uncharacterized protein n=1 Tax=Nitzschia inconspicua TaxID=303405 RepID=A0A9K3Q236_9STRA|nr:hypothetical protein IV203_038783 [Nitzschia inconspicua]